MISPGIALGFDEAERSTVGHLYWDAFGSKLRRAFPRDEAGLDYVISAIRPDHVLVARIDGEVAGVCGFNDSGSGAVDFSWPTLRGKLGSSAALRATVVLAPLEAAKDPGVFVLDGICVAESWRGQGVGTALLRGAIERAKQGGDREVQLAVIRNNPRAAALYERVGFAVSEHKSLGFLAGLYGFQDYQVMRYHLT